MLVDGGSRYFAGWTADGQSIVYWMQDRTQNALAVVRRRLDNGETRDLFRMPFKPNTNLYQADVSPDGRQVALALIADSTAPTSLHVVSTDGGESRQLFRSPKADEPIGPLAWSADNRYVFFVLGGGKARVMRASAAGGPAQETGVVMEGQIRYLRAHPDGRRIGFTAGTQAREVWVMENFLPRPEAPAKARQR